MRFPIKCKLMSIIVVVLASLVAVSAIHFVLVLKGKKDEMISGNLRIAVNISKHLDELIAKSRAILKTLARHPSVVGRNAGECDRLFSDLLPTYPLHLNIVAAGPDGENYGSAVRSADVRRLNYRDMEWFRKAREGASVVGDRHVSRLFGVASAMIAEPVLDGTRRVGVVGLPLDLEKTRELIAGEWGLPDRSTIDIVDAKGRILVCTYFLGDKAASAGEETVCFVPEAFRKGRGSITARGHDGIERLYSFAGLAEAGWSVIVGVPVDHAYAAASGMTRRFALMIITGAGVAVILGAMFARNITRRIFALSKGLEAVERGDLRYQVPLRGNDELSDVAGMFNRMVGERRSAEEALASSEQRYRMLVENAQIGIYQTRLNGDILYVNEAMAEQLGFPSPEEMTVRNAAVLYKSPADRERFLQRLRTDGIVANFEVEMVTEQGADRTVLLSATLDGDVISGMLKDITERRRAEEARREREERIGTYNQVLMELAKNEALYRGEIKTAFEAVTEAAARALSVRRVSIWFSTDDFSGIRCADLCDLGERSHSDGVHLPAAAYPSYFKALQEEDVIDAHDAVDDPRTREFSATYLKPLGISSMLDVPIRIAGKTVGVVCHEHVGPSRQWTVEEMSFAAAVSGFVSTAIEAHDRRRAEEDLRKANRALRTLSACNEALVRARDEDQLLDTICRTIVQEGGYRMCWVGYAERNEAKSVRPAARAGSEDGDREALNITSADTERGQGPAGTAIRTGRPTIVRNITTKDPRCDPWRAEAAERGYASSVSLPLVSGDGTFGALSIYSGNPDAFGEEEVKLLGELANDLSFGIIALRTLADRRQKEKFIENIFESMGEGLIVIDPSYRILSVNREYCSKTHLRPGDIIGKRCFEISHHRDRPCHESGEECPPCTTFRTGDPQVAVHTHYDREGKGLFTEVKSYPIKDGAGRVTSVIEIITDVTEKRRLEDQLHQAQKMEAIGTLASGIAHDFNNILSTIVGYTEVVRMNMEQDDPQRQELGHVLAASERATALTRDLLAFSRKKAVTLQPVDVNGLVANFEKFLRRLLREDIELRLTLAPGTLIVMADSGQVEQVLMNLVTNARDAMPRGGGLFIETSPVMIDEEFRRSHGYGTAGQYALVSVTDTGEGMDQPTVQRIFEPFFTTKEPGKGTGLGLATAYGIVKKHEGFIDVYSEPGRGTTFKIYLPRSPSPVAAAAEMPVRTAPPLRGTETVLVAEDDAALRRLVTMVLDHYGYDVIEAVDGAHALEQYFLHRDRIRLAILDGIMPKKNGFDVFAEIRRADPDLAVIIVSGYAEGIFRKNDSGGDDFTYLRKPVLPRQLAEKVRNELDKRIAREKAEGER